MTGCAPGYLTSIFIKRADISTRTTRSSQQLNIPLFRTATGQRTFYYRTTTIWNSLDLTLKLSRTISIFKKALKRKLIVEFLNSWLSKLECNIINFSILVFNCSIVSYCHLRFVFLSALSQPSERLLQTELKMDSIIKFCFLLGGRLQFRFIVVRDVHQRASRPSADRPTNRPGN